MTRLFTTHIRHLVTAAVMAASLWAAGGCGSRQNPAGDEETYTNPIANTLNSSCLVSFFEGKYYYVQNEDGCLFLSVGEDPTTLSGERKLLCKALERFNLMHLWHPQIINIDGSWYVYFTGDDGNTDNHQLYVLSNASADPFDGSFDLCGQISTDKENNWAIHAYVFDYNGQLYMIWSGWESRRVLVETQCIYIASMKNPWTLSSDRILISRPDYEWERQWVSPDGNKSAYPIFVNEAPFFFCNDKTDKAYIYYSASANWTPYYSVGELSAPKDADLLDPASWTKNSSAVFRQNPDSGIYGPGNQCIIPSPDSTEYYLIYQAVADSNGRRGLYLPVMMQQIGFSDSGTPKLGSPLPPDHQHLKPSGTYNKHL